MEEGLNDISELWKKSKGSSGIEVTADQLIAQARAKMRSSVMAHYGNIAIMAAMAILISVFYFVLYPMGTMLSNAGICVMIGVLIIRIAIEFISLSRSRIARMSLSTVNAAKESRRFYEFRKRMHGSVTIVLVGLYIVGWFMLTPEYSRFISLTWLFIMDGSFALIAVILILLIRKGLRDEIADLKHVADLQRQLEIEG
jgi:hypothetical protein